jgi:antitoxin (DNA-binding transcriptional repressor) of toxin-antitoxin stability system
LTFRVHPSTAPLRGKAKRRSLWEEIVIAKSGKPLAKLVPFHQVVRQPGRLKGKIKIGRDFAAQLPDTFESVASVSEGKQEC